MFPKDSEPVAKGTVTFHGTLIQEPKRPRWLEVLQNLVLTGISLLTLAVLFGVPHLRWDRELNQPKDGERLRAEHLTVTRYIGIGGAIEVRAGEYAEGLPTVLMVPLSRFIDDEPRQEL